MALFDFLRDDKGFFRGGAEGRAFGRTRDFLEREPTESLGGWREENTRQMARDFDVNDNASVLKLQQHMNYLNRDNPNYTQLAEDGVFGPKTEGALRYTQQGGSPQTNQIVTAPDGSLNTATTQVGNQITAAGGDGSTYAENRANNVSAGGYSPTFGFGENDGVGVLSPEALEEKDKANAISMIGNQLASGFTNWK